MFTQWIAPVTADSKPFCSDASGTSYNFTDYLAAVSPTARSKIGVSTQPAFPTGVGAKGSSGVAGLLSKTDGSIGYVDVAYAQQSELAYAAVENAANRFVDPDGLIDCSRCPCRAVAETERGRLHRRSAGCPSRLSDCDVHLRDRPIVVVEGEHDRRVAVTTADHEPWAEAPLRAASSAGRGHEQDRDREDQVARR